MSNVLIEQGKTQDSINHLTFYVKDVGMENLLIFA